MHVDGLHISLQKTQSSPRSRFFANSIIPAVSLPGPLGRPAVLLLAAGRVAVGKGWDAECTVFFSSLSLG